MASRHFADLRVTNGRITNGCAGLTLAQYLLARETHTSVDQITLDDIRRLIPGDAGQDPAEIPRQWGERLQALGHNLDVTDDPIIRTWQASTHRGRFDTRPGNPHR
ncbi:hypothetical protein [Streptomyces malaysiensis]|uniref:hypothetical protein n=1 Tax=Streptomyces malaysiensis TaxID=92644 RepID=UPI0033F1887D